MWVKSCRIHGKLVGGAAEPRRISSLESSVALKAPGGGDIKVENKAQGGGLNGCGKGGDQPLNHVPSLIPQLRSPSDQSPERRQSLSHPPQLKMDTGVIEGGLNVTLTIRLLMHGKVRAGVPRRGTRRIRPRPRRRGRKSSVGSRAVIAAVGQECAPWHPAPS